MKPQAKSTAAIRCTACAPIIMPAVACSAVGVHECCLAALQWPSGGMSLDEDMRAGEVSLSLHFTAFLAVAQPVHYSGIKGISSVSLF